MMGRLLHLSPEGTKNLNRAVAACVLANLTLFLPFTVIVQTIITLLSPLINGGGPDTGRLWLCLAGGAASAVLYYFAYSNEYMKTYSTAYSEAGKTRIEVAEHLRRLPLSFFNDRDLSELTTNMMGDCTAIEHTMSRRGKRYGNRERRDAVFMVMQDVNHQLFADSAAGEVVLSLEKSRPKICSEMRETDIRELAAGILRKVDMERFADRHPMSLSGGQKQRLAFACAIASGCGILLFDEPTSGLDRFHMEQTAELLKELNQTGKTVIVATHDAELIGRCCDRKIDLQAENMERGATS